MPPDATVVAAARDRAELSRRSRMRGRDVRAGYLMRSTLAVGLDGHRHIVLRKES